MFYSENDDDLIINDKETCFFDMCERNKLNIEVTHKVGSKWETIQGCLNGFNSKKSILLIKSRQGHDYAIPLRYVSLITIKGKW